jgi:predicted adenine nucleotide alpha hydrolase (AANH) superfamily ATPase
MRLERAASVAKNGKFDYFTSTLLISPYQKHQLIKEIGESAAKKYGVKFLYKDLRPIFKEGINEARKADLYMQKYCGCIYSERDRYILKKGAF